MKKMWKTVAAVCAATVMMSLLGSCKHNDYHYVPGNYDQGIDDSGELLEISGDVLTKCNDKYIPSDGFIEIPDGVTSIASSAFDRCTNLKNVKIPDSVTIIGREAFFYCRNLAGVTIGSGVTIIGDEAFCGCSKLMSVTIPDKVESIGNKAFSVCSKLMSVTIGRGVTSIGSKAFSGCNDLRSVTFTDTEGWHYGLYGKIDVTDPAENATNLRYGEWSDYSLYK